MFLTQVVISFLVGGGFIAILSIISERVSRDVAGIVLSLPSTMAIGVFFVGLVSSAQGVVKILPVVPLALGASYLFATIYVYIAQQIAKPLWFSSFVSILVGLAFWLLIALPLAYFEFNNFWLSLLGYGVLIGISHYFLAIYPKNLTKPIEEHFTIKQIMARSIVAGLLISTIAILAKTLGPLWGGVFSVFPAAMLSSMLIVHFARGEKFLFHIVRTMPAGSPTYIIYALIAAWSFPIFGIWIGSLITYGLSSLYLIAIHLVYKNAK